MCPCVDYDATPVKTVTKEAVKVPAKAVKAVARKIIGYKKVCGPNGCTMEPVYDNAVKSLPVRTYSVRRS